MLIITSFAGQILHILSYLTIYNMEVIPITNWLVTKCYLIYLLVWISLIFIYMCLITYKYSNDKKNLSNINKTFGFVYIFDVIILILIFYLPTYCFREENIIYTYGASVNLMYLVSILYIALAILVFILHSKQITKTKLFRKRRFIFSGRRSAAFFGARLALVTRNLASICRKNSKYKTF